LVSGDLDRAGENTHDVFDQKLEEAVQRFQKRHGLKTDGTVGRSTMETMNIPVEKRIRQIALNMDRMRWLPDDLGDRYVFVNIADFHLEVVEDGREVMTMKIIVGKRDWRSCVLSAKMSYLELNPYWKVPDSIATKEILPKIKKNPEYLARRNIKMLRNWNDQGEGIDPKTVDWSRIGTNKFPYRLRQEPGPGNALGRIKFIFPNECEIYLHDTPTRHLFGRQRRDFSHGCIRIEKPIELATYLLRDKPTWTSKKILAEIRKGKRQVVMLSNLFDVHIFYGTAWLDRGGTLQFRNDIYHIDEVPYTLTFGGVQTAAANL
jgi:murein L,D-transpeptidase YcbB/YkuD